jgi:hypothetical protein
LNSQTAQHDQSKQATAASNTAFAEPHQSPQVSEGLLGSLAQPRLRSHRILSAHDFLVAADAFVIALPRTVFPQISQGKELKISGERC